MRATFVLEAEVEDADADLLPKVPEIIRDRLSGTAIRIVAIEKRMNCPECGRLERPR
jgi:hypothetical protein